MSDCNGASTDTAITIQLPDLPLLFREFELRANQHIRSVSESSEKWLTSCGALHESHLGLLPGLKAGLLAGLAYPTCDTQQLRLAADLLGLVLCSNAGLLRNARAASPMIGAVSNGSGQSRSEGNSLPFHQLRPRLAAIAQSNPAWSARFNCSAKAFQAAQERIAHNRTYGVAPRLEAFLPLRRDLWGLNLALDLVEHVEGLDLPSQILDHPVYQTIRHSVADAIGWSADIAALRLGYTHNLVSILISERGLSIHGGIRAAGYMVKQSLDAFRSAERTLISLISHHPPQPVPGALDLPDLSPPLDGDDVCPHGEDVYLYIQGLRDLMIGSVHWLYETNLYFEDKGDEVRAFGWVFLSSQSSPN